MRAVAACTRAALLAAVLGVAAVLLARQVVALDPPDRQALRVWVQNPMEPSLLRLLVVGAGCLLWLLVTGALGVEVLRRVANTCSWHIAVRLPGPAQSLTAAILGAVAVTSTSSGVMAIAAAAPAATSPSPHTPQWTLRAHTQALPAAPDTRTQTSSVTVHRGDTLWELADRWLGDPQRWKEIHRLNAERYGGMRHGHHIEPGWKLALPAGPSTAGRAATPKPPPPLPDVASAPTPDEAPAASTGAPIIPDDDSVSTPSATTSPARAAPADLVPSADAGNARNAEDGIDLGTHGWVAGEVAAAVCAALALTWIHRRRHYRPRALRPTSTADTDTSPPTPLLAALHHAVRPNPHDTAKEAPDMTAATVTAAALGHDSGQSTLRIADLPRTGLALSGPGAEDAARGLLVAALSAGGPWAAEHEAWVIVTSDTLRRLLPSGAPLSDRLQVADTVDDAMNHAERLLLQRARELGEQDDDEPEFPPGLLILETPDSAQTIRLSAIITVAARLGIRAVIMGTWDGGEVWAVDRDGGCAGGDMTGPARLNVLDVTAADEILALLRQVHSSAELAGPGRDAEPIAPLNHQTVGEASASRPLTVTVLGRIAVTATSSAPAKDVHIRRSDGVQIMVYLAVHPDGATSDDIMAALWPEIRPRHARGRFHTTMSELRGALAEAAHADAIIRTGDRYHFDPGTVAVDLWNLHAAVNAAATALEPADHLTALREVTLTYQGPIADGHSWLWLVPEQGKIRRRVLDAYAELAEADNDPRSALRLLEDAITIDPYNEDLYVRAMRRHAAQGNAAGVRRTIQALSARLAELEIEPTAQTRAIAIELMRAPSTGHFRSLDAQ